MRKEVRPMRRGGGGKGRVSTLFRVAALAFFSIVLVQFVSMFLLHDTLPSHSSKPAEYARPPPATALHPENPVEGEAAVAANQLAVEARGMEQTKKWLSVVSGSPHWLSPKEVGGLLAAHAHANDTLVRRGHCRARASFFQSPYLSFDCLTLGCLMFTVSLYIKTGHGCFVRQFGKRG